MELYYNSAIELMKLLNDGKLSSEELVKYYFNRIEKFNGKVNSVVEYDKEKALMEAVRADEYRKNGNLRGCLHGLPCTVKESFNVKGMLTTSGAEHLKDNRASENAPSIQRLCDEGAIIIGKTNVPALTADWQTYNDIYGTTSNPWDIRLTTGGSSGGSAAALAADFTSVEFGSDLCGCLRIPAHYTGVYAHRCSLGLLSVRGHIPGGNPGDNSEHDMTSAGPMGRCAADLRLMMKVLYNPWIVPKRKLDFSKNNLKNKDKIKVLAWFNEPGHDVDNKIIDRYNKFLESLTQNPQIEVEYNAPKGVSLDELLNLCMKLCGRLVGTSLTNSQRTRAGLISLGMNLSNILTNGAVGELKDYYKGMKYDPVEQSETDMLRNEYSKKMKEVFKQYDILLSPISPVLAFSHMHQPFKRRKLKVNGNAVDYNEHLAWNALSTVLGLPATIIPLNKNENELPCGIQIISSHFHDDVTIDFAELCENITGGFKIPTGY